MERKRKSSELKLMARRTLAGKYGISVGMQVILALLALLGGIAACMPLFMMVFGAGLGVRSEGMMLGGLIAFLLMLLIMCVVGFIVSAGIIRFFYHMCTGQEFGMGDLLYGFKNKWWRFVGLGLLFSLIGFIAGIPEIIVDVAQSLQPWATWLDGVKLILSAITMVISIVISLFFGQAIYILVEDREKKVFQSLAESVRLMRGNKGRYLYFSLSFIGVTLLGLLSFGIGLLWVLPYSYCASVYFYLDIKKHYLAEFGE
ncbi:MAG TPA: DUF975 family protein [Candidatus Lachnoclostridium stercorigallinarum]|uniref:DUF975 family protein n=1 Tax=Candidatus Lachnoclostridium stercorigallinarum TaxID=2838634 RepID=A0A9D2GGU8_9FIRM|nr:DUF975 family protein [Candidatus Lachnoclostridium stercorigallinarum]